MAATNTTLHIPTVPPMPQQPDMATAAADHKEHHIALPPPALFDTYVAICVVLLVIAALAVSGKLLLTWRARGRLGKDDGMIVAGFVTLFATGIMGAQAYNHGLGKPTTLIDGKYPSWVAFRWEYIFYAVWFLPLCFSKLAFFAMYLRTFSASGKVMRGMLVTSMLVFVALTILFITGTLLMSEGIAQSPIVAIKALRYHVQFRYLHYAWGVCDIAADLWICALPLLGLKVLKISCKRKIELCLKFCVPAITWVISMFRIFTLNLVMSRNIMTNHTWDPSLAETVPVIFAFAQAAAAVIITTLPSFALRLSIWHKARKASGRAPDPLSEISELSEAVQSDSSKTETGETTPATSFTATNTSVPTSSQSRLSKVEKILGMGQRFKRSRTPDEYSEESHRMDSLSGITVTRTVNVTSALDPEEGFKFMYRKYCGQA